MRHTQQVWQTRNVDVCVNIPLGIQPPGSKYSTKYSFLDKQEQDILLWIFNFLLTDIGMRVSSQSEIKRFEDKLWHRHFVVCSVSCMMRFCVYVYVSCLPNLVTVQHRCVCIVAGLIPHVPWCCAGFDWLWDFGQNCASNPFTGQMCQHQTWSDWWNWPHPQHTVHTECVTLHWAPWPEVPWLSKFWVVGRTGDFSPSSSKRHRNEVPLAVCESIWMTHAGIDPRRNQNAEPKGFWVLGSVTGRRTKESKKSRKNEKQNKYRMQGKPKVPTISPISALQWRVFHRVTELEPAPSWRGLTTIPLGALSETDMTQTHVNLPVLLPTSLHRRCPVWSDLRLRSEMRLRMRWFGDVGWGNVMRIQGQGLWGTNPGGVTSPDKNGGAQGWVKTVTVGGQPGPWILAPQWGKTPQWGKVWEFPMHRRVSCPKKRERKSNLGCLDIYV